MAQTRQPDASLLAPGAEGAPWRAADPASAAWLSVATAVLAAVSSLAGLLVDGLYRDPSSTASMLRAYDLVTLVVVVPALVGGVATARRGSVRGRLVWLGMLAAVVYTTAYYLVVPAFNDAFLVHVALFACALAALVLGLRATDAGAVTAQLRPRTPHGWVSGFFALMSVALGGMWVYVTVRFAGTDDVPAGSLLVETEPLVHLGIALDLSVLVPAYAASAVLLWRRQPWGYVLGTVMAVSGTVHQIGYVVALPFQVAAEVPGAVALDPGEPPIAAAFLVVTAVLLAGVRPMPGVSSS